MLTDLVVIILIMLSFSFAIGSVVLLKRYLKSGELVDAMGTAGCVMISFVLLHVLLATMVYDVILS